MAPGMMGCRGPPPPLGCRPPMPHGCHRGYSPPLPPGGMGGGMGGGMPPMMMMPPGARAAYMQPPPGFGYGGCGGCGGCGGPVPQMMGGPRGAAHPMAHPHAAFPHGARP